MGWDVLTSCLRAADPPPCWAHHRAPGWWRLCSVGGNVTPAGNAHSAGLQCPAAGRPGLPAGGRYPQELVFAAHSSSCHASWVGQVESHLCIIVGHFTRKHFLIHRRPKQMVWWRTCESSSGRWRPGSGRPLHETRPPPSGAALQLLPLFTPALLVGVAQSCHPLQVNSASHDLVHERWPTPSLHCISCLPLLMQGPGAGGSGGAAARAAGRCGESGGGCSGRAPAHFGPG